MVEDCGPDANRQEARDEINRMLSRPLDSSAEAIDDASWGTDVSSIPSISIYEGD